MTENSIGSYDLHDFSDILCLEWIGTSKDLYARLQSISNYHTSHHQRNGEDVLLPIP